MIQINFIYKSYCAKFASVLNKAFFFILLLVFSACNQQTSSGQLDALAFQQIASNNNAQIIDLRPKSEFDSAHLANAVSFVPNSAELDAYIDLLYKDIPVCVVGTGSDAKKSVIEKLSAKGFKQVYELKGGYTAWTEAKLPFVKTVPKKIYDNDTITFDKAIMGNKLVMVDFNATWCKPCKMMQPSIDKIHDTRSEEVVVYSIDTDQHPEYNEKYQIRSIPLVMLFKNGKILHRSEGLLEESQINELIDQNK